METYLVGGAVRDRLLGLPVKDRDFVVVGATPDEMKALGFSQVGKDFPVFLHPDTREEYALARTERKTGPGHTGFEFHTGSDVSLADDLYRRDLTINAIASDESGAVFDPWGGQQDLDNRRLRHVSEAFREDPLRVLRTARFKARLQPFSFEIAEETLSLMRDIVKQSALLELSADRIIGEVDKALATPSPATFFQCLEDLGAGQQLWPEITAADVERLASSPATLTEAAFATLTLGKSEDDIRSLTKRLRCSNLRRDLSLLINRFSNSWPKFEVLDSKAKGELVFAADGLRKRERFQTFAATIDDVLNTNLRTQWLEAVEIMAGISVADIEHPEKGPALGQQIRAAQLQQLAQHFDDTTGNKR